MLSEKTAHTYISVHSKRKYFPATKLNIYIEETVNKFLNNSIQIKYNFDLTYCWSFHRGQRIWLGSTSSPLLHDLGFSEMICDLFFVPEGSTCKSRIKSQVPQNIRGPLRIYSCAKRYAAK